MVPCSYNSRFKKRKDGWGPTATYLVRMEHNSQWTVATASVTRAIAAKAAMSSVTVLGFAKRHNLDHFVTAILRTLAILEHIVTSEDAQERKFLVMVEGLAQPWTSYVPVTLAGKDKVITSTFWSFADFFRL